MKKQTGITLIALIITIIVLLILAGVTINLTLGEKGIFRTAQRAVQNYKDAQDQELAYLNYFEAEMNNAINGLGINTVAGGSTSTPTPPTLNPVTGITVTPTSASMEKGQTVTLTASVTPITADDTSVTWSSDNTGVATVSGGVVTGVGVGSATITATSSNGLTATCSITVTYKSYNKGDVVELTNSMGTHTFYVLKNSSGSESQVTLLSAHFVETQWYTQSDNAGGEDNEYEIDYFASDRAMNSCGAPYLEDMSDLNILLGTEGAIAVNRAHYYATTFRR